MSGNQTLNSGVLPLKEERAVSAKALRTIELDMLEKQKESKGDVEPNHLSVFRGYISHFLEMQILTNFDSVYVIKTSITYCPRVVEDLFSLSQA